MTAELTLTPDRRGYVLGAERLDGFNDRPDLDDAARRQIAAWAARWSPDALSDAQRELLTEEPPAADERLARGLIDDRADLQSLYIDGLLDELSVEQRALLANPSNHELLHGAHYPLSVSELATLIDGSPDQVRHWADARLVPAIRVGVDRRFGRGAVARAMVLSTTNKAEKAVLASVRNGQGRRLMLILGAVIDDALASRDFDRTTRDGLAKNLRRAADQLSPVTKQPSAKKQAKVAGARVKVIKAKTGWAVVGERGRHVAVAAKQAEAVTAAKQKLRAAGGGELAIKGERGTRVSKVRG